VVDAGNRCLDKTQKSSNQGITVNRAWINYIPGFLRHRLEGRPDLQKILLNTGWLFADKILRMGIGLFVGIWIARYLGPEQFGLLSYAQAFVAIFSSISSLGLESIVVRNLVRVPDNRNEILGSAFFLRLVGGVVSFLIAIIAVFIVKHDDLFTCLLVGVIALGFIFQAFDTVDMLFQAKVISKFTILPKQVTFMMASVIKVFLVAYSAPLVAFAWVGVVEALAGACGLAIAYKFYGYSLFSWSVNKKQMKNLLADSWPLIFSGIVIMIYMRIDQVMLGSMSGNKEVGIYAVAVGLAEAWYFFPGAIATSMFPSIVNAKETDEELFYCRLQRLYNVMALLGFVVAVPITFTAGWLVELLYGPAYAKAGPQLAVLVWAGLFVNLGIARSSFLTVMNWTRLHLVTVSMGCVINIVLNCLLIPRYGGLGAVIASCAAYWFAAHGICFLYRPLFRTGMMLNKALLYPKVW
jgi:O-antigen/teichoic acid export membrane protein